LFNSFNGIFINKPTLLSETIPGDRFYFTDIIVKESVKVSMKKLKSINLKFLKRIWLPNIVSQQNLDMVFNFFNTLRHKVICYSTVTLEDSKKYENIFINGDEKYETGKEVKKIIIFNANVKKIPNVESVVIRDSIINCNFENNDAIKNFKSYHCSRNENLRFEDLKNLETLEIDYLCDIKNLKITSFTTEFEYKDFMFPISLKYLKIHSEGNFDISYLVNLKKLVIGVTGEVIFPPNLVSLHISNDDEDDDGSDGSMPNIKISHLTKLKELFSTCALESKYVEKFSSEGMYGIENFDQLKLMTNLRIVHLEHLRQNNLKDLCDKIEQLAFGESNSFSLNLNRFKSLKKIVCFNRKDNDKVIIT
jgi:hypothetical protein